ncbi:MAG TPA: tetratricopeptide repeat protein [Chthoniobacterales bacterium]|jgi:tetratricopeptide (TPR) repeat protein
MPPPKTEKQLSSQARSNYLKAISALELKNYQYGITLLQDVLREEPGFVDGRKVLRKVATGQLKEKKGFFGLKGGSPLGAMKAQGLLKKDPAAAMDAAEKILETDPYNTQANQVLKEGALALDLYETARFAMETVRDGHPKEPKVLHELARLYYENGEPAKAVEIYSQLVEINRSDMEAVKLGKDAAAAASMKSGGWEAVAESGGTKDYRDLIKDKDLATSLEQQGRVVRSEDMIENQLAELTVRYNENPSNIDVVRKMAGLFEQKGDLPTAVQWFTYAASLTQNTDATLVRKATDLQMKLYDENIKSYEDFLAANPDDPAAPEYQTHLTEYRRLRAEVLLGEARKRVEKNPTDLMLHFELGEVLVNSGAYREAIPELQTARKSPNVRLRAMNLLGRCYQQLNMLDLSVRTFQDAAKEILVMDGTKKDILYNLGLVLEQMEKKDESLDCFKQIYEVDYGYKDVAARVESSYGG